MDLDFDTNVMDLDTLDKALDKIESSIRTLLMTVQRIRAARNRLVPIHRLPPELLVKIFNMVARPFVDKSSHRLLKLTWVSRHWRDLALESPSLWTVITNSNWIQAEEWIARSKECPLSIDIIKLPKAIAKVSKPRFVTLLSHFHRLRQLRLTVHQCHLAWSGDWVKETTASLMTSLELERIHLPGGFFEKIPNVQIIHLRRCQHLWFGGLRFPNLTSLHIIYPRLPVPVRAFVESLNGMPQLERLVLVHALITLPLQVLSSDSPPSLDNGPRLSLLKLGSTADIDTWVWFLQTIRPRCITPQTTISCNFDFSPLISDDAHLPRLLSSFDRMLEGQGATSINYKFDISADNHKPTISINYRDINVESEVDSSCRSSLSIGLDPAARATLLTTLQQNLGLSHLQALRWCDPLVGSLDSTECMRVLGGLPKLEYLDLRVRRDVVTSLLQSSIPNVNTTPDFTTPPPPPPPSPPFCALRILQLRCDQQAIPFINEFLTARKSANIALDTVILSDKPDSLNPSTFDVLEDSVSRILFDGSPVAKLIERSIWTGVEGVLDGCSIEPFASE